ncbi:extracellular solute-binding protein [Paenibacillus harenae]|uniref:extracellular solute-binding protein n=1 Tax=Paenibacillus harenae TaxID=306543 RepID=UPI00278CD5E0|nr:extracellular solute-binding protein [Paenibacillus harenae]MDQ0058929.1 ABC-type glycerol-3-phosphate transport system substrate-binding protein [Paenibacillus harenae]
MLVFIRKYTGTIILAVVFIFGVIWWQSIRGQEDQTMVGIPEYENFDDTSILASESVFSKLEPSYLIYLESKRKAGIEDTEGVQITLNGAEFAASSSFGVRKESGIGGRNEEVVVLSEEDSWVEYEIEVPQEGFYQMGMSYYALDGQRSSVLRNIQIDGQFPFIQLKKLEFMRMWEEAGPVWKDRQGNEYNPSQQEVFGWQYSKIKDADAKVLEPFRFHLTKGRHTIRLNAIREPAAIATIDVFSPVHLKTYEEYASDNNELGVEPVRDTLIKMQAEDAVRKSSPTLRRVEVRDPATEPFNKEGTGLNTMGGAGWRVGGQWIEWEFDVPKTGLYQIGLKAANWFLDGLPVQRTLYLDGEIPFDEMKAINFKYEANWQMTPLGDEKPYWFYLEEGRHTIRMEVMVGALGEVFERVQDVSRKMSFISRETLLYTGTNPDPNREWELDKVIPNLIPRLHIMARDLDDSINLLYELGVSKGSSQIATLAMARNQLLNMAEAPDSIPSRLGQLSDSQSQLGTWISGLSQQSLQLDYFVIKSEDRPWPRPGASWFSKSTTSVHDFFLSFRKDYRGVGDVFEENDDSMPTIEVWISRGRDWATIIKQLADEEFTAETGIRVNVNVVPAGDKTKLLLATTTGIQPDVALGIEADVPIDFAVRGALVNLNDFDDYEEVASRFRPGALIPYKYNGGDYALPENQNFNMLFYRKDILEGMGITKIPDTWEEVMDLIPLLQQEGMDFYYPHAVSGTDNAINEFAPFLFQNGGDFYHADGKKSALDSEEAMNAFRMWTGLFTNYKISKDANFYNRFRTGEMPIGIADYSTYVMLSTAAPELTGWWGMKPMPGIRQQDGTVNRSTGGLAQTAVLFNNSDRKQQGWEFIKWWTSADVQERFGIELESLLGVEARWNTANVEALTRLPWPQDDIEAVLEQWKWFKERQVVLGGYYTSRHIGNTWNEIVLNGKNQREAIEDAVIEINKELRKKREEFGLEEPEGGAAK